MLVFWVQGLKRIKQTKMSRWWWNQMDKTQFQMGEWTLQQLFCWHSFGESFLYIFAPAEPPTQRREITKLSSLCNGNSSMVPGAKMRLFISQDAKSPRPPTAPSDREYWMNSANSKAAEFFPLNLSSKTLAHLLKIVNSIECWQWR